MGVVSFDVAKRRHARSQMRKFYDNKELTNKIKRIVNRGKETFMFDTAISINPATAGAVLKLSTIAQGDDINNRNGDEVSPLRQSLTLTMETSTVGTAGFTTNNLSIVRVIVFQDRHGDSTPTVNGTTNTSVLAAASVSANYNLDTMDRYKILYDKRFSLAQAPFINTAQANAVYPVGNSGVSNIHMIKIGRNLPLKKMEFADTTGTLPAKGQTYILTIVHALATSQVITIAGYSRLKYKEL